MMTERRAPGLTDDWLNAWLAAVGATVLVQGLRLHWSAGTRAHALFTLDEDDDVIAARIAEALPSKFDLDTMVIANRDKAFPRNPTFERYRACAGLSRGRGEDFTLSSSLTDLVADVSKQLPHSEFDPSAPQGKTLWDRVCACVGSVASAGTPLADRVAASLDGLGQRVALNGLGFDARRIEAGDPPDAGKWVDPIVETLAFYGLALFPVRGDGRREATRGWAGARSAGGRWRPLVFRWPSWRNPLDRWAIDALCAEFYANGGRRARSQSLGAERLRVMGVRSARESVSFQKSGALDQTSGYASRRTQY